MEQSSKSSAIETESKTKLKESHHITSIFRVLCRRSTVCIPMHVRLSLPLTMYPSGQAQVPPSGDAWQRCWQLREAHLQIPEQRTDDGTGETAWPLLARTQRELGVCVGTDCSCGRTWRRSRPLRRGSEASRHTGGPLGCTGRRRDRATRLGNTPSARCLRTDGEKNTSN